MHDDLIQTLSTRFAQNMQRHEAVLWDQVFPQLHAPPAKLVTLSEMERTGGAPDVVVLDGTLCFVDCSTESPTGRRSLCFDQKALDGRKENKPMGSAQSLAQAMGCTLLTESQYRALQALGTFDLKTSS